MKIITVIMRRKTAQPRRRTETVELLTNWTTRDWADLPVHHPRQDCTPNLTSTMWPPASESAVRP